MRWLIVAATFMLSVLLYVDRVCISVAKKSVATDLSLDDRQMGWVFGAFSLGYALMQTPSGWLADRLGPRRILAMIVSIWSVFTGLTALATSWTSMVLVRFLFGAGEAGAFPGIARANYSWIPMQERGIVQGINFSGSRIGAALALPIISWSISEIGWRPTFVFLMVIGFVWAAAWYLFFRNDPVETPWLSSHEREWILRHRQQARIKHITEFMERDDHKPLGQAMLRSSTTWALCAQYFASNFTFFFALTWFLPELQSRYSLTGFTASLFAAIPMACGAIGNWLSGWTVDRLYSRGHWTLSRRVPAILGFILAAIGILGCAFAATPWASSLWFSLCVFGADMTLAPSWSTCVDIGKIHSGFVSGTMNMAGNLGSFLTAIAFPTLLAWTKSPLPFFFMAAVLNVAAALCWLRIEPTIGLKD